MKKIFFLLCFLFSLNCFAQQEWAPVGTIWHYQFFNETCLYPYEYITYKSVKDTLINSQPCRIIEGTFYGLSENTIDFGKEIMYGDSVNVYIYTNNKFYKIYDFSAQPGDTITVIDTFFAG